MSADNYLGTIDNPLSLNRYTYVQNNPLAYVDPSGHIPVFLIPAIIGAVTTVIGDEMSAVNAGFTYRASNEISKF